MREVPAYIAGHQDVVDHFGYWPSCHDSPVLRFTHLGDEIELHLEAWEMTPEVDSRGYFVLTKRHHIGFRFSGIVSTQLESFLPENILYELGFSSVSDFAASQQFEIILDSAMGSDLCGSFVARSGQVTFVTPIVAAPDSVATSSSATQTL